MRRSLLCGLLKKAPGVYVAVIDDPPRGLNVSTIMHLDRLQGGEARIFDIFAGFLVAPKETVYRNLRHETPCVLDAAVARLVGEDWQV